ncbi:MAG TPA: serpin family protein [Gemmatimonadales bacterium]
MLRLTPAVSLISALVLCSSTVAAQATACGPGAGSPVESFAWQFISAVAARKPGENVAVSPASAAEALQMLQAGAGGSTRRALDCAIGTERPGGRIATSREDSAVTLAVGNSVWVRSDLTPAPAWVGILKRDFRAEVASLVLSNEAAKNRINAWVKRATRDKITSILDQPPDDTTLLILLNAVYFKGRWAAEFDSTLTRPDSFDLRSGKRVPIRMMWRTGSYRLAQLGSAKLIRLPYRGDRYAFYVALPDSGHSLAEIERRLDSPRWRSWQDSLVFQDVRLGLPRFRLEATENLIPSLTAMRLGVIFSPDSADFWPMFAQPPAGSLRPFVGEAKQKVFLEVNEEGTEAAAVTEIGIAITSAPPPPVPVVVNRPFLFMLQDDSSRTVLFAGRVVDPGK